MNRFIEQLRNPEKEFTMMPFWFLNGRLTDEEIKRQILQFKSKGVYGFVLHPRLGIPDEIQYLSDEFMHYMRTAVTTAAEAGMQVILYDEGMYPSGSAHGKIVEERPELASTGIKITDNQNDGRVVCSLPNGKYIVQGFTGGTIRGIHFGEDDGEPGAPKSADILNPDAVNLFIRLTHERYYEVMGEYFGNTIIGFFTDEPSAVGRNSDGFFAWTNGFDEELVSRGGKLTELEALFYKQENTTTDIYRHMLVEREGAVYYGALSKWCENHGIALMGHPHTSDDIEVERYFTVPGQDVVLRWIAPEFSGIDGIDSTMGKCSADAARLMNRRRNSNECFGACNRADNPWYLTGGDVKWYTDWLAVRGVNLFIPHAFYYSIEGQRKAERPPDVGPNSIWWEHYDKIADYIKRLSYLNTDITSLAKIAVLCDNKELYPELVRELYQNQIEFNYLPVSFFSECKDNPDNNSFSIGESVYQYVIGDYGFKSSAERLDTDITKVKKDIVLSSYEPLLRVSHFLKSGYECRLFVNEGEDEIDTEATINRQCSRTGNETSKAALLAYDIWEDCFYSIPVKEAPNDKISFRLKLPVRGSLLIINCNENDLINIKSSINNCYLSMHENNANLKVEDLTLISDDKENVRKTYEGIVSNTTEGPASVSFYADEMAELYVNDEFSGVSMWNPHIFNIKDKLISGQNNIRLVVTGSLANKYGNNKVAYGLWEKNIIFDMDGVLFDTEQLCIDTWEEIAEKYGISKIREALVECIGTNAQTTRSIMLHHYGEDFPYDKYVNESKQLFDYHIETKGMPVKRGAAEILSYLKKNEWNIGLASSTRVERVKKELSQAGLLQYFDVVIGGDLVEASKPEPDIFLKCCEEMKITPEQVFIIEDSYNGIRAASRAGARAIMVPDIKQPDKEMKGLAMRVFKSLDDVRYWFDKVGL